MRADWPEARRSKQLRQWRTLERIAEFVEATPQFSGMILLGSLAKGVGDAVSDIDLLIVAPDNGFTEAWARRNDLHRTGALAVWDGRHTDFPEAAAHVWLTEDLIVVEALIATPRSGARLAEPAVVLLGPTDLGRTFPNRLPVSRAEMSLGNDPVERAYEVLKQAIRGRKLAKTNIS